MRSALLFGLLGAALQVSGHPVSHNSHASSLRRRAVNLNAFRLKATAEYINSNATLSDASVTVLKRDSYVETATNLVKRIVPGAEVSNIRCSLLPISAEIPPSVLRLRLASGTLA